MSKDTKNHNISYVSVANDFCVGWYEVKKFFLVEIIENLFLRYLGPADYESGISLSITCRCGASEPIF